jgi:N-acetylmuramoyl-L-alanine amidase CwlA
VGNPGSSALANRNWFENGSGGANSSAHYIVGLNGEILRCVPENECAAHAGKSYGAEWTEMSKTNNSRFIGIESCHPGADGKFNEQTTNSLVELVADICLRYKLNPDTDVYRHYDVCGKSCPLYYVNNPVEWTALKTKFKEKLHQLTIAQEAKLDTPPAADDNAPSNWAVESWNWAKQNGVVDGTRPTAAATREECAAILFNFNTLLKKE